MLLTIKISHRNLFGIKWVQTLDILSESQIDNVVDLGM